MKPDRISEPSRRRHSATPELVGRSLRCCAVCLVLAAGGDELRELGRYQRDAIENGRVLAARFGASRALGLRAPLAEPRRARRSSARCSKASFATPIGGARVVASAAAIDLGPVRARSRACTGTSGCRASCTGSWRRARSRCCFAAQTLGAVLALGLGGEAARSSSSSGPSRSRPRPSAGPSSWPPIFTARRAACWPKRRRSVVRRAFAGIIPRLVDSGEVVWISSIITEIAGHRRPHGARDRGVARHRPSDRRGIGAARRHRRRHGDERAGCRRDLELARRSVGRQAAAPCSTSAATHRSRRCSRASRAAPEIVVNNAGITRDNLLMRMKPEEWNDVVSTNLSSLVPRLQGELARHDEGALRAHHQHQLRRRPDGQRRARRTTPRRRPA